MTPPKIRPAQDAAGQISVPQHIAPAVAAGSEVVPGEVGVGKVVASKDGAAFLFEAGEVDGIKAAVVNSLGQGDQGKVSPVKVTGR